MSSPKKRHRPGQMGDYEVGYGRPPMATRFKPGNNCNPRGRPKKKKTVGQVIDEALSTKVRITVDGKTKIMTKLDIVIHNLINAASRGDRQAIYTLLNLRARYQDSTETTVNPSELSASDRQIIEQFLTNAAPDGTVSDHQPRHDQQSAADDEGGDDSLPEPERDNEA
jgi:hypothetical protein